MGPAQADGVRRRARPRRGRADHHRRLLAHQARLAQAVRRRDDHAPPGDAPPRPHRRRPRRGRRDRDAGAARGALRLPPVQRRPVEQEVADHAVPPQRPVDEGGRRHRVRVRELGRPGAEGGVRRGRDHGLGGLPGQPVPRPAHQRPHRPLGRLGAQPDALRRRGGAPVARRRPRGLPDHLPPLAARPRRGRPDVGGGRRARPPARGRRRHTAQHRHRLARGPRPHDHHPGAAGRLAVPDRTAQGRGLGAGVRVEPDQLPRHGRGDPRHRRRRPRLDGPAAAGGPAVRREGRRRSRRRDQHVHRLQPGLPGPRVRQQARHLPGQPARRARDVARPAPAASGPRPSPARRGRGCRAGRALRRGLGGRAGLRRHALREVRRDRRPVPAGDGRARQGGLRRDPALLRPPARGPRRHRAPRHRGLAWRTWRGTTT